MATERKTSVFQSSEGQVRVTCGVEENEPFLEIAERIPPTENSPEKITICVDTDLNDTPDACGETETHGEGELRMVAPPRENLDRWFRRIVQEVASKINQ